jgi:DNA-binding NarL/FixJ family response regulator
VDSVFEEGGAKSLRLKTKKRYFGKPPSQKEFLTWKLLAQGLTSKEIAKKRRVSVGTIETVRSVLLSKLGARNGPTLIAMWYTRRKKLERNEAIEAGVLGRVDNTHTPAT